MAERVGIARSRVVVFIAAVALAAGSAVWAVSGVIERHDAASQLARDRAALRSWRAAAVDAVDASDRARAAATKLAPQVREVSGTADTVAGLDEQELALLRAVFAGIPAANVAGYDQAVIARNALGAQHNITVEALRADVEALTAALEALDRAPVPKSS
jgi:hypothetical protein